MLVVKSLFSFAMAYAHGVVHELQQTEHDIKARDLIVRHLGSMPLVRVNGSDLRDAGVIPELVRRLQLAKDFTDHLTSLDDSERAREVFETAIVACAALRDMGCGSSASRVETRTSGGLHLIVWFVGRVHGRRWNKLSHLDLRGLTVAVGAIRNVGHSTRENSDEFHRLGVTKLLSWRLLCHWSTDESTDNEACEMKTITKSCCLPPAGSSYREAAFRSAGALINVAEKSDDCVKVCGSDRALIDILVESWGGKDKKKALISPGLHRILKFATKYDQNFSYLYILEKEEKRRKDAQNLEKIRSNVIV